MLGKRPYLLRTTSSRSLLIPCEHAEGEPATFCNYAQVTEKNPHPALSAPCKIVIGFDIGAKKNPTSDACESPRSVLDTLALLPSQEKQNIVARSPRSGLGSLLTVKSGSGVGLEIVSQILDKEAGVHVSSSFKATFHLQNCSNETHSNKMGFYSKSSHCSSKDIGWLCKADFMDADIPPWQRQAPCVLSVEDECLDADISPYQSRACSICPNEYINTQVSTWQSGADPGSVDAFDGCTNDHIPVWQREPQCLCEDDCTDTHITSRQRHALHHVSLDMESEENSTQQSIFSAASPPSCSHSLISSSPGFLKVCAFCGHALRLGKDIFMYRGDQAFCSTECRNQKIALDECKEMQGN